MNTDPKSNIIFFPTKKVREEVEDERQFAAMNTVDDAITISNYLMDVLQSALDDLGEDYDLNIDMADRNDPNYKDFSVMLNLLVSIFFRRAKMGHVLHDDLDDLYDKITDISKFSMDDMNVMTEDDLIEFLTHEDDED